MKKITFLLTALLLFCFTSHSQVQLGFGNNASQNLPFGSYYQYSYCQSIYLASDINASGTITTLQWYFNGTGSLVNSQQMVVYLGETTKNVFASTTDWEPISNLTPVYLGGITTNSTPGWKTITLSTPFNYTGTKNLVVAIDENSPSSDNLTDKFYCTSVTGKRSLAQYSNTVNSDPNAPSTATSTPSYVPNIILGGISQVCPTPNTLSISNISTSSATVSWVIAGDHSPNGYDYYISTSSTSPIISTVPTGNLLGGTSGSITGLNPATTYYVWIRSNCGDGLSSNWSEPTSFVTGCVPVSNFIQLFDGVTVPNLPVCWSKILRGDSISPAAKVQTVAVNFNSSPNSLQMVNAGSIDPYDIIAVSPELSNIGSGTYRLRVYVKGTGTLEVGSLDTNTSAAVFNVVQTITDISTNYKECIIDFSPFKGSTDKFIGFRMNAPQNSTLNLDNIVWEPSPSCPDVTQVTVPDVSYNTATIGWTEAGTELSWDVAIGLNAATDPNTLSFTNTTTSGYFLATGLTPTTKYKVWVRAICANNNGAWIGPIAFTTTCAPQADFFENFDTVVVVKQPVGGGPSQSTELPYCWSKLIRANSGIVTPGTEVYTSLDIAVMPSNSVNTGYIKNNNSTGNFDLMLISPPISSLSLGNHRLKFYSKFSGKIEIGTLDTNTNSAIFTLFKTITILNGFYEYVVDFSTYTGTDKYIAFRFPNDAGAYAGFVLDNITWEVIPSCPEVSNIVVASTTVSGAMINWSPSTLALESSYQVVVGDLSVTNPDTLTLQNSSGSTPSLQVSGLQSGTYYKVWVRAVCNSTSYGAWVGPVSFSTECAPVATFYETFDGISIPTPYSTKELPACWTRILRGGPSNLSQFAYIDTFYANTSLFPNFTPPNYIQVNPQGSTFNADVILVSPAISTLGLPYRLKFDTFYPATLEIGVVDGNTNNSTFTVFKTVTIQFNGSHTVVDFTGFNTLNLREYNHIGIRVVPDGTFPSFNIDNIIWEPTPSCPDMTKKITIPITSPTSAIVNWSKESTETSWQVVVHTTNPNLATPISVSGTPTVTVNNLLPNTTYFAWVRTVCGSDLGAWSLPVKFVTPCLSFNVPYSQDFQSAVSPSLPSCTDQNGDFYSGGTYWQTSSSASSWGFTSKAIRCFDSDSAVNACFFTGGVNLEAGKTYTLSYLIGTSAPSGIGLCGGYCGPVNIKVMYGTSPTYPDGMTTLIKNYVGLVGPANTDTYTFTVPTSGVYYFSFCNYSDAGQASVAIDNILIDGTLANNNFDISQLKCYPNPVKDVLSVVYNKNIDSLAIYTILGQKVLYQLANTTEVNLNTASLTSGTYFLKVYSDNQVKVMKFIKE